MITVGGIVCDWIAKLNEIPSSWKVPQVSAVAPRVALNLSTCPAFSAASVKLSWLKGSTRTAIVCMWLDYFNQPMPCSRSQSTANLRKLSEFPWCGHVGYCRFRPVPLDSRSDLKELDYSPWFTFIRGFAQNALVLILCGPFVRFGKFFFAGWAACWNAWSRFSNLKSLSD